MLVTEAEFLEESASELAANANGRGAVEHGGDKFLRRFAYGTEFVGLHVEAGLRTDTDDGNRDGELLDDSRDSFELGDEVCPERIRHRHDEVIKLLVDCCNVCRGSFAALGQSAVGDNLRVANGQRFPYRVLEEEVSGVAVDHVLRQRRLWNHRRKR